ncbi:MAG: hypothetical protein J2P41_03985 [Blastocatellia bacterium]|nr:hypothetical protein [Blastocatellia bacterium]
MDRRLFLKTTSLTLWGRPWLGAIASAPECLQEDLPRVAALEEPHFPSRLYQFVWRNWELANLDCLAQVIGATEAQVEQIGLSMGLPKKRTITEDQRRRIYITVIRQNWHILPESQIIELLQWDEKRFRYTLKEDDFLDIKLGRVKPDCAILRYSSPSGEEQRRAAEIRRSLKSWFAERLNEPGQNLFAFIEEFNKPPEKVITNKSSGKEVWSPRYLYSHFALYGDPLLEGDAAGLPDGYLARAAQHGINGVWIQAVLNNLAPSRIFPEFGTGSAERLKNLRELVTRAGKFGINIYLYLNEPRAMPPGFFANRPEIRGEKHLDLYAMCTSSEPVRDWIRSSLSYVFREVPKLGGLFSITMSENHTNCFSHGGAWGDRYPAAKECPRCSRRNPAEVIAELITTFRDGVREESKTAEIISYDWGWGTPLAAELIPKLPQDSSVLSISEWDQPVFRGGVHTKVGEYSISVVGPGPRALKNWALAKQRGLKTIAKTQFNNTWEISAVPYIPVLPLVLDHCEGLAKAGIDGAMASWTCGGYPSANLRAAADYAFEPRPAKEDILRREANLLFGEEGSRDAILAWNRFSEAFQEFPYGVAIYILPTQHGPANLLRLKPTHLPAGMILFPYDDYRRWSGAYPPEVVLSQLRKLAGKWREGLVSLEQALKKAPANKKEAAARELAIARTCQNHFQSTANQIEFYLLRDKLTGLAREQAGAVRRRMLTLMRDEMELSKQQYFVARNESLIAYEASNHYYYTPLDLVEKMLNCEYIERILQRGNL